jgi:hypothetical protein
MDEALADVRGGQECCARSTRHWRLKARLLPQSP